MLQKQYSDHKHVACGGSSSVAPFTPSVTLFKRWSGNDSKCCHFAFIMTGCIEFYVLIHSFPYLSAVHCLKARGIVSSSRVCGWIKRGCRATGKRKAAYSTCLFASQCVVCVVISHPCSTKTHRRKYTHELRNRICWAQLVQINKTGGFSVKIKLQVEH